MPTAPWLDCAGRSEGAIGQPRPVGSWEPGSRTPRCLELKDNHTSQGWTGAALEMSKVTPREYKDMRYIIGIAAVAVLALLMYIGVTAGR